MNTTNQTKTKLEILNENVQREINRDCYAEWVQWARTHGYAKVLKKQGII